MKYPSEIKKAFVILQEKGFEAYIVGGCLRNIMMGKEPHDWDMTTSALPSVTAEIFRAHGYHVIETGLKHGTVTVVIDGKPTEITTFRIDGEYSDSRHPDKVIFTPSLSEDLARRDFTVNAMAYSDSTGLVDLYGGKSDLELGLLRCVGDPRRRFEEDALRILRAFRFASEHGFQIERRTLEAVIESRDGLFRISRERIYAELCRILLGEQASRAVGELIHCGILPYILPGCDESYCPRSELLDRLPPVLAPRLACLIADMSEDIADNVLISLKMSNSERSSVKQVLSALKLLCEGIEGDLITARKLLQRFGENASYAVCLASLRGVDTEDIQSSLAVVERENFPRRISDLAIGGREIMKLGALGRETGEVLSYLLDASTADPGINQVKALTLLAEKYISEMKK